MFLLTSADGTVLAAAQVPPDMRRDDIISQPLWRLAAPRDRDILWGCVMAALSDDAIQECLVQRSVNLDRWHTVIEPAVVFADVHLLVFLKPVSADAVRLTPHQQDILRRFAAGHCAASIARDMCVSQTTIHTQLYRLARRLGGLDRHNLALWARENLLI